MWPPLYCHNCAELFQHLEYANCLSYIFCQVSACDATHCLFRIYDAVCIHWIHLWIDNSGNTCTCSHYHHEIGNRNNQPFLKVRNFYILSCTEVSQYLLVCKGLSSVIYIWSILRSVRKQMLKRYVYMRQWIWSTLFQIMACRLFRTNPLSKPMLGYC